MHDAVLVILCCVTWILLQWPQGVMELESVLLLWEQGVVVYQGILCFKGMPIVVHPRTSMSVPSVLNYVVHWHMWFFTSIVVVPLAHLSIAFKLVFLLMQSLYSCLALVVTDLVFNGWFLMAASISEFYTTVGVPPSPVMINMFNFEQGFMSSSRLAVTSTICFGSCNRELESVFMNTSLTVTVISQFLHSIHCARVAIKVGKFLEQYDICDAIKTFFNASEHAILSHTSIELALAVETLEAVNCELFSATVCQNGDDIQCTLGDLAPVHSIASVPHQLTTLGSPLMSGRWISNARNSGSNLDFQSQYSSSFVLWTSCQEITIAELLHLFCFDAGIGCDSVFHVLKPSVMQNDSQESVSSLFQFLQGGHCITASVYCGHWSNAVSYSGFASSLGMHSWSSRSLYRWSLRFYNSGEVPYSLHVLDSCLTCNNQFSQSMYFTIQTTSSMMARQSTCQLDPVLHGLLLLIGSYRHDRVDMFQEFKFFAILQALHSVHSVLPRAMSVWLEEWAVYYIRCLSYPNYTLHMCYC